MKKHAIHKHTSLRYTWAPIKTGRRVSAIRFSFTGRRFAESKVEAAQKRSAKVTANAKKKWAALKEAEACAREKNGVCTLRDREKRVCAICDECDMLREFANSIRQREASTNQ